MIDVQLHKLPLLLLVLTRPQKSVVPLLVMLLDNLLSIAVLAVHEVIVAPIFSNGVGALR